MSDAKKGYTLERLSDTELKVTKLFDGPIDLVWKIHTDPTLVPQWWGSDAYETVVDKMDFKVGGAWRFVSKSANGDEQAFKGVYTEIDKPNKFVATFEWEGMPGHIVTDNYIFEEKDGKTLYTDFSVYANKEDMDGMIENGMEEGMAETLERIVKLIQKLK